jgi:hypothetical protein
MSCRFDARHLLAASPGPAGVILPAFPYDRRVSLAPGKRMEKFDSGAVKVIYAAPIVALLPFALDAYVWSFGAGAMDLRLPGKGTLTPYVMSYKRSRSHPVCPAYLPSMMTIPIRRRP